MTANRKTLLNRFVHRVAAHRVGIVLFSPVLHHLDHLVLRLTNHRATASAWLSGIPVVILTTTGARSGLRRSVPLLCIRDTLDEHRFAVIASNWGRQQHPGWYYNLKVNPLTTCEIAGQIGQYRAHEAQGAEYQHFMTLAKGRYAGYHQYEKRAGERRIPVMVLAPAPQVSKSR